MTVGADMTTIQLSEAEATLLTGLVAVLPPLLVAAFEIYRWAQERRIMSRQGDDVAFANSVTMLVKESKGKSTRVDVDPMHSKISIRDPAETAIILRDQRMSAIGMILIGVVLVIIPTIVFEFSTVYLVLRAVGFANGLAAVVVGVHFLVRTAGVRPGDLMDTERTSVHLVGDLDTAFVRCASSALASNILSMPRVEVSRSNETAIIVAATHARPAGALFAMLLKAEGCSVDVTIISATLWPGLLPRRTANQRRLNQVVGQLIAHDGAAHT
jgi:hypothetical protein